jgi:hypothetical protein
MKRAQAQAALDAAFADGMSRLFGVLVTNFIPGGDGPEEGIKRFGIGLDAHRDAHASASAVIDSIFSE